MSDMRTTTPALADVLARLRGRTALNGHDGRSGATLERAALDDVPVIVKTVDPSRDLTMRATKDTVGREIYLWQRGLLDNLGPGVGHAIIAAGRSGEHQVTVMHDLGDAVAGWHQRLSRTDLDRVFGALSSIHQRFAGRPPAGLVDLPTRLTLFSPDRLAPLTGASPLVDAVLTGWQYFADLVAEPVVEAVFAELRRPARLLRTLGRLAPTLCHGDAWIVNLGLTPGTVFLLDWNLATAGPAVLDFVGFAVSCSSHVDATIDDILLAGRSMCLDTVSDEVWQAAMFWALCELGWNKALDAATNHDPATRFAARNELEWWVKAAEPALNRAS